MRTPAVVALLGLLALAAGPASAREEAPDPVAAGSTAFGIGLYGEIRGGKENLFFSPYSISLALSMAREGAAGKTAEEMDEVLHLPRGGAGDGHARLRAALAPPTVGGKREGAGPAYELSIANALWGQKGYAVKAPFLARLRDGYAASFPTVDFRDAAAARAAINAWVEEQTKRRIQDLIPEGLPTTDTRMVLANAVYFKAAWEEPFREASTEDAPFRAEEGEVRVRMMRRTDRFGYLETNLAQVLELPYVGRTTSMVVILPKAKDGLGALEQVLRGNDDDTGVPDGMEAWLGRLGSAKVDVRLPRWKFTSGFDLSSALKAMGMRLAFDAKAADFSGIVDAEPLFIGAVLHKAFVGVDEKGTEAAAATAVMMRAGSAMRPEPPVEFKADHPFLFVIRHVPTGTVLFMGRVTDPTKS
jgi:serpin B